MRTITPPLGGVRTYGANRTYGAAFKAASDVGTISFVKTKRNRTHETCHTPKSQTSRLNSQVSDGLRGFNQLKADSVRNACVRLRRLWAANRTYGAVAHTLHTNQKTTARR